MELTICETTNNYSRLRLVIKTASETAITTIGATIWRTLVIRTKVALLHPIVVGSFPA